MGTMAATGRERPRRRIAAVGFPASAPFSLHAGRLGSPPGWVVVARVDDRECAWIDFSPANAICAHSR